jgi:hypothetical protein
LPSHLFQVPEYILNAAQIFAYAADHPDIDMEAVASMFR